MAKRYELDKQKDRIINLYINEGKTCTQIGEECGYSLSGIYDALKRWNIKTRSLSESHKVYKLNEDFFEKIDSEEKAYWLGFIYADGYISKNKLGIALACRDKNHLYKFIKCIDSNIKINEYKSKSKYCSSDYCRVIINSKKMVDDIKDKGVLYNKSLILRFPDENILDKNLYRHFIRGYFDGDGSLVLSTNSINFKICGTKEMLEKFIDIFNENSDYSYKNKLYKRWNDEKNNYYLSYGGRRKTLSIMNYLYSDSKIFLERKFQKFILLCNIN